MALVRALGERDPRAIRRRAHELERLAHARPSGIDDEVMSQIGTRVTALLDNERDISAVLMGVSGAQGLREVLARLDTRQQALILGHAVPMPVVVQTRAYGPDLYAEVGHVEGEALQERLAQNVQLMQADEDFEGFD